MKLINHPFLSLVSAVVNRKISNIFDNSSVWSWILLDLQILVFPCILQIGGTGDILLHTFPTKFPLHTRKDGHRAGPQKPAPIGESRKRDSFRHSPILPLSPHLHHTYWPTIRSANLLIYLRAYTPTRVSNAPNYASRLIVLVHENYSSSDVWGGVNEGRTGDLIAWDYWRNKIK